MSCEGFGSASCLEVSLAPGNKSLGMSKWTHYLPTAWRMLLLLPHAIMIQVTPHTYKLCEVSCASTNILLAMRYARLLTCLLAVFVVPLVSAQDRSVTQVRAAFDNANVRIK
jgi:hypothetical protein